MTNLESKLQVLNENRGDIELKEYVEANAQSDPNFFRWLFSEEFANDFDQSLSDEQKEEYQTWLSSL